MGYLICTSTPQHRVKVKRQFTIDQIFSAIILRSDPMRTGQQDQWSMMTLATRTDHFRQRQSAVTARHAESIGII